MQRVLVVDCHKKPLMPCHPARARMLLKAKQAAVFRRYPFTIILLEREGGDVQLVEVKFDPGCKVTGVALIVEGERGRRLVWAAEITHRGQAVKSVLDMRRAQRRSRRTRQTRYREARFNNRRRAAGWLPPSLRSRVQNSLTWVKRLRKFAPVGQIALERVKFDTQLLENPDISGVQYQQGTLEGYEVREFLLEKWGHRCAYCGRTGVALQVEHIVPRARGGTDRVANLTVACESCNLDKNTRTATEYGHPEVQAQARSPLKDTEAVNTTRWALYEHLKATNLPVVTGTGGRTKYNRTRQSHPKANWIDAACVGESGERVYIAPHHAPLLIKAVRRQRRQMTLVDCYGFPRSGAKAARQVRGFQTGDIVKAVVPAGKHQGMYLGRVVVKASGNFTVDGKPDISWRYCAKFHSSDGYEYQKGEAASPIA